MTLLIVSGAVVCLLAACALFLVGVAAAADPGGRGGDISLGAILGGIACAAGFVGLLVWAWLR